MSADRPKAVVLRPLGECPQWGTQPGATTPIDEEIRSAGSAPIEVQRELFFGLVRHLDDAQLRVSEEEREDPSDNEAWIASLATWFGWADEVRDLERARAAKAAYEVLDYEIGDDARDDLPDR